MGAVSLFNRSEWKAAEVVVVILHSKIHCLILIVGGSDFRQISVGCPSSRDSLGVWL